ncbi:MAG: N-acetylmuramoyl-L-alanine amidase [Bacteroidetes bacterium]|nr:N-acetylmuramoyl-L-alanine amidase [Bacteroidota bacterium]
MVILSGPLNAQRPGNIHTVVIDAGHGGHDPGALGQQSREKNINLAIALKLGKLIRTSLKDVRVIYTRDQDYFVELYRRAGIANESKADLFISIHCNANKNHGLKGAETYVMGLHKSQANLNIAKLENAAILLESDYQSSYNGFDPNSDESYIIFSLNQNLNLDKSTDFAAAIQQQMEARTGMNNRGVRQAGFLVLYKTTMPSVLVETGYLSNPDEEKFLISDKGQEYIAGAIYKAFKEIAGIDLIAGKTGEPGKKPDFSHPEKPAGTDSEHIDTAPVHAAEAKNIVVATKNAPPDPRVAGPSGKLSYRVQIAAETKELRPDAPKFSRFKDVRMYKHGGMYKYTVGDEADLAAVLRLLAAVREKGARDAFVVIFRNGERIPQAEADKLMRK